MRSANDSLHVANTADEKQVRSRSGSRSSAKSGGGTKYTNADLPFSLGSEKSWRNQFCNSFFDYIGTLPDPWTIKKGYIQVIWDLVYPMLKQEIEVDGVVFAIISNSFINVLLTHSLIGVPTGV